MTSPGFDAAVALPAGIGRERFSMLKNVCRREGAVLAAMTRSGLKFEIPQASPASANASDAEYTCRYEFSKRTVLKSIGPTLFEERLRSSVEV